MSHSSALQEEDEFGSATTPLDGPTQLPGELQKPKGKGKGLPPVVFIAVGGAFVTIVLGAILFALIKGNKPESEVVITSNAPTLVVPAPAQEPVASVSPAPQFSEAGGALYQASPFAPQGVQVSGSGVNQTLLQPPAAPALASAKDLEDVRSQVASVKDQQQQILDALAGIQRDLAQRAPRARPAAAAPKPEAPKPEPRVNQNFEITAIVGNRAWLKTYGDSSGRDFVVGLGEAVAGSYVKEINAGGKYIVLDNGDLIR